MEADIRIETSMSAHTSVNDTFNEWNLQGHEKRPMDRQGELVQQYTNFYLVSHLKNTNHNLAGHGSIFCCIKRLT